MTDISIIVPTYNRLPRLKKVLEGLAEQTHAPAEMEVIVVSDGSTDGTMNYLARLETAFRIILVEQANTGPARARNNGVSHASGEYVLFLDDDVVPSPALISEHLSLHAREGASSVSLGPMLTPADHQPSPWVDWEQAMLYKQYHSMEQEIWKPTPRQFFTGNTSAARSLLEESGGFDPTFRRTEDVELAMRLAQKGAKFYFNPRAFGYHYAERTFATWFLIPYDYGKNDVIFFIDKGHHWFQEIIRNEYHQRNPITRVLTRLCLDHPFTSASCFQALRLFVEASYAIGLTNVSRQICSAIFNVRYYQGASDQLGGRAVFQHIVNQALPQNG